MKIKTHAVFAADDGAGAAGAGAGAAVDGGAAPPPPAAGAAPPPARPDWLPPNVQLDQQFIGETAADTISRLEAARSGLRKTVSEWGAVPEKPDGYKIDDTPELRKLFGNPDDAGMQLLREVGREAGITDRQFGKLLTSFAKGFIDKGLLPAPLDPMAEAKKLAGPNFRGNDAEIAAEGKRRETAAEAWVNGLQTNGTMSEEEAAFLKSLAGSAAGITAIEKLQRMTSGGPGIQTGGQGGGAGVTDADLDKRLRDPRYFIGGPQYDPEFAAETERLNKARRSGAPR